MYGRIVYSENFPLSYDKKKIIKSVALAFEREREREREIWIVFSKQFQFFSYQFV